MGQTFISYSSTDRSAFRTVKKMLEAHAVPVTEVNQIPVGQEIAHAIHDAVSQSDCCIFLLSESSKNSTWCMAEIGAFWGAKKPIFIYHVGKPIAAVPELLTGTAWARSLRDLVQACKNVPPAPATDPHSLELLGRCGMTLFRIPADNTDRQTHVKKLIREEIECAKSNSSRPCFRLLASSGHSYIHPTGPVWTFLGLCNAVEEYQAGLQVVLESPFSQFALTRALANDDESDHWLDKVSLLHLKELSTRYGAEIRVTELPINCSLFFTSRAVLYDPYLWARARGAAHTENNFFVIAFTPTDSEHDCYELLAKHFDFLFRHSIILEDFLAPDPTLSRRRSGFEKQRQALKKGGVS